MKTSTRNKTQELTDRTRTKRNRQAETDPPYSPSPFTTRTYTCTHHHNHMHASTHARTTLLVLLYDISESSLRNHIVVVAIIGTPGDTLLTSTPQQQQLPAESKLCGATSLFCKVQILEKPEKQPEEGEHVQKASVFLHMIKL